jgi:DNA-binding transcriptional regulator GbsR (MarR family)
MSIFEHRNTEEIDPTGKMLSRLRATLDGVERERDETPQMAHLRRILAGRIAAVERKTAWKERGWSRFSSPFGLVSVQLVNVEVPQC